MGEQERPVVAPPPHPRAHHRPLLDTEPHVPHTVLACGPRAANAVAATIAELISDHMAETDFELERSIMALGHLRSKNSVKDLTAIVRRYDELDESIVRTAAIAAGAMWQRHKDETGLHAFAVEAMDALENPSSRAISMYLKAIKDDPTWRSIERTSPLEHAMAAWCEAHTAPAALEASQEQLPLFA